MHCIRSETILLRRLDLKSHFSDCFLTIRAYFEFILRGSETVLLERGSAEILLDLSLGEGS